MFQGCRLRCSACIAAACPGLLLCGSLACGMLAPSLGSSVCIPVPLAAFAGLAPGAAGAVLLLLGQPSPLGAGLSVSGVRCFWLPCPWCLAAPCAGLLLCPLPPWLRPLPVPLPLWRLLVPRPGAPGTLPLAVAPSFLGRGVPPLRPPVRALSGALLPVPCLPVCFLWRWRR